MRPGVLLECKGSSHHDCDKRRDGEQDREQVDVLELAVDEDADPDEPADGGRDQRGTPVEADRLPLPAPQPAGPAEEEGCRRPSDIQKRALYVGAGGALEEVNAVGDSKPGE